MSLRLPGSFPIDLLIKLIRKSIQLVIVFILRELLALLMQLIVERLASRNRLNVAAWYCTCAECIASSKQQCRHHIDMRH